MGSIQYRNSQVRKGEEAADPSYSTEWPPTTARSEGRLNMFGAMLICISLGSQASSVSVFLIQHNIWGSYRDTSLL